LVWAFRTHVPIKNAKAEIIILFILI